MDLPTVLSLAISLLSLVIAAISVIYTIQIGKKSIRISNESAKMASEQENIKRALKYDILRHIISVYQNIVDFNDYLYLVLEKKRRFSLEVPYEFYMSKFTELSNIRSSAVYYEYIKAISTFKKDQYLTKQEIQGIVNTIGYISNSRKESILELAETEISEMLMEYEKSCWRNILDTAVKIKHTIEHGVDDANKPSPGMLDPETGEAKEILVIFKFGLYTMESVNFLLALLKKYEPELTEYLARMYNPIDIK